MQITKFQWSWLGISSGAILSILVICLLCPLTFNHANAAEISREVSTQVQANVNSMVAVSLPSTINLDVVPKSTGNYTFSSANLKVATNSISGYAVFLKTAEDNNALQNSDQSISAEIKATSAPKPLTELEDNSWGYALSTDLINENSVFAAVPATISDAVIRTDTISIDDTSITNNYNLAFGTKINTNLPAGSYSNSVLVSVVANPLTVTNLNQLVYMQDMSSDICANTLIGSTKQLIDTRDGNSYWVAKMKDNKCWMLQNLALDITESGLKSLDTDIATDFVASSGSITQYPLQGDTLNGPSYSNLYSWNVGKMVDATPWLDTSCAVSAATISLAKACDGKRFVDVSGSEWQPTFQSQPGTFRGETYDMVAVDEIGKTYDPHYLVGNYYQYNAATAGTGVNLNTHNASASGSICPKNWRLPNDGAAADHRPLTTGDAYKLLISYGYPDASKYTVNEYNAATVNTPADMNPAAVNAFLFAPRSGGIYLNSTSTWAYIYLGSTLVTQSSSAAGEITNYHASLNGTIVAPAIAENRRIGYSVRCLAR